MKTFQVFTVHETITEESLLIEADAMELDLSASNILFYTGERITAIVASSAYAAVVEVTEDED